MNKKNLILLGCWLWASTLVAQVKLAGVFTDNMVFQREKPVNVWGIASPNVRVTVRFAGQTVKAVANGQGEFQCVLKPLKANAKGETVTLSFDQPLTTNDGNAPRCFTLSDGRKYNRKPKSAVIQGNQVILTADGMKPTHVSYAYDEAAITNLCNREGLPAWPFK